MSSIFEKTIKNIPLILGVLTFLSYSSLHYYYTEFGIEIYEYLNISELLLLFFPSIHSFIVYVIGAMFFTLFTVLFAPQYQDDNTAIKLKERDIKDYVRFLKRPLVKKINNKLKVKLVLNIVILSWRIFMLFSIIFAINKGSSEGWFTPCPPSLYDDLLFWLFLGLFFLIVHTIYVAPVQKNIKTVLSIVAIVYFVLWTIKHNSNCRVNYVKSALDFKSVSLVMKNKEIKTNSDTVYVGGVRDYVFLYVVSSDESIIYKKSNVDVIKINNVISK